MAMEVKPIDWAMNYRAVFGPIGKETADAWSYWLSQNIRGSELKGQELNETVAEMCSTWPHRDRRPDVKDIFWAIVKRRQAAAGESVFDKLRDQQKACAMCYDGMIAVRRTAQPDTDAATMLLLEVVTVPCLCSAGQKAMESKREYRQLAGAAKNRLLEMARLGLRQMATINKYFESLPDTHPDARELVDGVCKHFNSDHQR